MSGSVIKLESFASATGSAAMFNAAALDEAYREGYADGRADERGQDMKSLIQQIRALTDEISDDDARRAALRGEAVQVLSPILEQLIDALVPTSDSARLERALTTELAQLAQRGTPLGCRIACSAADLPMVERCIAEAGAANIEVAARATGGIRVELQGGRIEFDPDRVAADIRALIAEIKENDAWTTN